MRSAVALHREGAFEGAEAGYRAILAEDPDHVGALHFFGVLRHHQGDDAAALDLVRRAIERAPDNIEALNNLGNIHLEMSAWNEAESAYRTTLKLRPDFADGYNNLGLVLGLLGRPEDAEAALEQAIAIAPRRAEFHFNLGLLLRRRGLMLQAFSAFKAAVTLDPGQSHAFEAMAQAQYVLSHTPTEAIATLSAWLSREPNHPAARHILSALTGTGVAPRAADQYIKHLFDGYAASFDSHLAKLDYNAPRLIETAMRGVIGEPQGDLRVLDAGCGTGRWGELLRPFARELTGVDLSGGMIEQARRGRGYDGLEEAELTTFLAARHATYDLIFSADTLIYFGDLSAVLPVAAQALEPGGTLAFSLERLEEDGPIPSFTLQYNGRYAHTRPYVVEALAAAGLTIARLETGILRLERGTPAIGWIVIAQKPAT
ncbi:MAG TPA: tetratricopeptide repeat protein [Aliidongia sp.]|uniref:tetratricopeptide repeat protein n=1 Tax=Aliidongia sp. TaxID=1914230 RepID=UPI002DDDA062|nr:tetratricopeptide repeat protein [Aliidongia sp.]HEV2675034.1 tetratricopeptide repeat protein [Aliidongia sp.]